MSITTTSESLPVRAIQTALPADWSIANMATWIFPTEERNILQGNSNWLVWLTSFTAAASACGCAGILNNTIPFPSDTTEQTRWWNANDFLKCMLLKCIAPKLIVKIVTAETLYGAISILRNEYGSASPLEWFTQIAEKQQPYTPIQDHITRFQSGLNHLSTCGFLLPEMFAVGFFVASLWRDPDDSSSWFAWAQHFKISTASTLQGAIHDILVVSHLRRNAVMSSGSSQLRSALVTVEREHQRNGRVFCRNPACPSPSNHAIGKCRVSGGGAYSTSGKNRRRAEHSGLEDEEARGGP